MKKKIIIALLIAFMIVFGVSACALLSADEDSFAGASVIPSAEPVESPYRAAVSLSETKIREQKEEPKATEAEGDWYTVTTESDPLNLREEPRQDAALCGQIPRGGFVYITEKEGIWGLTLYDGVTGWLNLSYCQSGQVEVSPEVSEEATVTVYVTNTGECYHRGGCSYLYSKIPISLADAKGSYRPCSRCHPPQ